MAAECRLKLHKVVKGKQVQTKVDKDSGLFYIDHCSVCFVFFPIMVALITKLPDL